MDLSPFFSFESITRSSLFPVIRYLKKNIKMLNDMPKKQLKLYI